MLIRTLGIVSTALAMVTLAACSSPTSSPDSAAATPQPTAPASVQGSSPKPVATLTPSQLRPESVEPTPTPSPTPTPTQTAPAPVPSPKDDKKKKPKPVPVVPDPNCDSNYTSACVPIVGWDLDCGDIGEMVIVVGQDIHRFDADGDGRGCESYG